jgi:hypothetical protein
MIEFRAPQALEAGMNRWMRKFPPLMLIGFATCAGNRAAGMRPDMNVLSARQVAHYSTALQAVTTMRSQWLRGHAPADLETPAGDNVRVICDGMEVGGVDVLQYMSTTGIAYIRHYDGLQATWRWGLGHENGVIFVSDQDGAGPGFP